MRHVEKERVVPRLLEEAHCLFRVARGERREIGGLFDLLGVVQQRPWAHVIAVGDAEVFIESARGRQIFRTMAEMPFADTHGAVSGAFQHLSHGGFGERQAGRVIRPQHPLDARARGITPREQGRARRRTNGIGGVELREADALGHHAVEIRREDIRSVDAEIPVAQVVGVNENNVGRAGLCAHQRRGGGRQKCAPGERHGGTKMPHRA